MYIHYLNRIVPMLVLQLLKTFSVYCVFPRIISVFFCSFIN